MRGERREGQKREGHRQAGRGETGDGPESGPATGAYSQPPQTDCVRTARVHPGQGHSDRRPPCARWGRSRETLFCMRQPAPLARPELEDEVLVEQVKVCRARASAWVPRHHVWPPAGKARSTLRVLVPAQDALGDGPHHLQRHRQAPKGMGYFEVGYDSGTLLPKPSLSYYI